MGRDCSGLKRWACRFKGHSMWEKMGKVQSRGCIVGKNVKWVNAHSWEKREKVQSRHSLVGKNAT